MPNLILYSGQGFSLRARPDQVVGAYIRLPQIAKRTGSVKIARESKAGARPLEVKIPAVGACVASKVTDAA